MMQSRRDFIGSLVGSATVLCWGGCKSQGEDALATTSQKQGGDALATTSQKQGEDALATTSQKQGEDALATVGPKLALNASTLRGYGLGLYDQVKAAIVGGFTGFEPWMKDIHAAKADGSLAKAVALARVKGLKFVNGIAFGQWVSPDAATRKAGLEETKRDMAALAEMECPFIAASMFGVQKPGSPILSKEAIAERFAKVCELGDRMGVKPLLEYWGHSVNLNRPEDALDVLKLVGRSDTALLADVYHTYRGGGDFATFRRFTPTMLPVLHVNDYPATIAREKLVDADRVWPGDGVAPWRTIFTNLNERGANPWLSIEVFNPSYWESSPEQTAMAGHAKLTALQRRHAVKAT